MALSQQSDFATGLYQISASDAITAELNESIDRIEKQILTDLMGIELKSDYDTNIALPTPDQEWIDLRDGKVYDNTSGIKVEYEGLKKLVIPFIYADYIIKVNTIDTPFGQKKLAARNSIRIRNLELRNIANKAYNEGINQYSKAKDFINQYPDDYQNWVFKYLLSKC